MNAFGIFLRKFRLDQNGMSLRDMAKNLGISPSLLSAYETGRRDIRDADALFQKILESFPMSDKNEKKLRASIDKTLDSYRVDLSNISPDVRHRYVEFARRIDTFSLDDFEKLESDNSDE